MTTISGQHRAPSARTGNILGALALALTDEIRAHAEGLTSIRGEAPSALVSIGHEPGCSIDFLSKALRLSHPGTVRLVDRLEGAGLIERRAASDGRAVALHLTEAGSRRRRKVLAGRQNSLDRVLATLTPAQQEQLAALAGQLLKAQRGSDLQRAYTICRLCDDRACTDCPMEN